MNRRHFLNVLGAGTAGMVLDPERLLWVPGRRTFFLPTVSPVFDAADVVWPETSAWGARMLYDHFKVYVIEAQPLADDTVVILASGRVLRIDP